ncbi:MAG TPA: ABC transporter ATP-binding protein [Dehalococcoidales bacterium]|nr:ABC transporter ATP-binding protein [Dehalococcoidales bacterium]
MNNLLEVRNLTTHFHTQDGVVQAVNDVSFYVDVGETIALVGESGCGKTVSALSILRLIQEPPGKIKSGQILFHGADLLKLSNSEMQKIRGARISMIFQEPLTSLNPVLTIGLQLSEALEFHRNMSSQEARDESIRLLEAVGIPRAERRVKEYPHNFSGGMRQRVMIAMAISCHPNLIVADEPTTAVDVTVQAQLLALIKDISKRLNTSLILITHNLGIVARYAQRVYVMYGGRIVEHGSAKDVFHTPAHPYTIGLLSSVPRLDEPRKIRLSPITGQPPDLIFPEEGCAFRPRCNFIEGQCAQQAHSLVEISPGHFTACSLTQNGKVLWKKT